MSGYQGNGCFSKWSCRGGRTRRRKTSGAGCHVTATFKRASLPRMKGRLGTGTTYSYTHPASLATSRVVKSTRFILPDLKSRSNGPPRARNSSPGAAGGQARIPAGRTDAMCTETAGGAAPPPPPGGGGGERPGGGGFGSDPPCGPSLSSPPLATDEEEGSNQVSEKSSAGPPSTASFPCISEGCADHPFGFSKPYNRDRSYL
jgi:hypothetical protein